MTNLNKAYDPQTLEKKWYQHWESKGYFAPSGTGEPYCIMLPPPNVTGNLHMGHGFGFTLIDVLIRYQRMSGKNTLWQGGTDHAGIATQMVVERKLTAQGKTRHALGRDAFVEQIWAWKQESGDNISRQLRRLGASIDWDRERFTMDPALSEAVREVFIKLHDEGLIYRGQRLVNWDPVLLTAISDLEVVNQEEEGKMYHLRYPLTTGEGYLTVATTRPETLLGDVAIAVHREDARYQHLIGQQVKLPLTERLIPIIADNYVDPLFGTGCVKITPAHDFNDDAVGKRHHLEPINIFTPTAHLNENVPARYQGMDRFDARERLVKELDALGLIEKVEKHKLKIPRGDRSHAVIEPYLTFQWYVDAKTLAKPAMEAVQKGDIRFIPENWTKTYFQWMDNIEDWCISRQLWWGHRIPVWYDDQGNHYAGQDEANVRERHQLSPDLTLTQDNDVLDTWFSSALWPFASLGWPKENADVSTFFPTSTLITGFDIIFFWVARMIMMSLKLTKKVPFREVYITGLIRDAEGHKMSKSKGNVLDPIDLIDGIDLDTLTRKRTYGLMQPAMAKKIQKATQKEFPQGIPSYGTDALRFTFCAVASYTREIRFDTNRLGGYRNFCNKLWNAARYVMMNTTGKEAGLKAEPMTLSLPDRFIQSRLQQTIQAAHAALKNYRFDLFAQTLYEFTWNEFCDWYLELSKPLLTSNSSSPEMLRGTRHTLTTTLETLLRLLHPIMPYITEELWQPISLLAGKTGNSIMQQPYPESETELLDEKADDDIEWLKNMIVAIRSIRSDMNMAPHKLLSVMLRKGTPTDHRLITEHEHLLSTLAKLESIVWLTPDQPAPASGTATAFVGELEIVILMEGLIDQQAERARLNREIAKLEKDLSGIEMKLNNPQFLDKAPAVVVEKERLREQDIKKTLAKLHLLNR
ncbi:MAG: valine--tRNA ligase [Gammaproteobacteria bacterium RIFCSPHIGHO2_12_FULL_45_12]|nr:MAG: valine--tRNA ligase [Gammaproteobacteria bacterium RIFCSPHIGHO2_12_FULL_45_12]